MARILHHPGTDDARWYEPDLEGGGSFRSPETTSSDECLALVEAMAERSLAIAAAEIAQQLLEVIPAGTEAVLPTGVSYRFDADAAVGPVLTRDGTPLNSGSAPAAPSYSPVAVSVAHRIELLGFFAELPVLLESLAPVARWSIP